MKNIKLSKEQQELSDSLMKLKYATTREEAELYSQIVALDVTLVALTTLTSKSKVTEK
jgi:hypothetical protein